MPEYQNPVLNEREKTHGSFERTAELSYNLKLFMAENGKNNLSSVQAEALSMIATKIARILSGNPNEVDHWKDIAGYAELVVESLKPKA